MRKITMVPVHVECNLLEDLLSFRPFSLNHFANVTLAIIETVWACVHVSIRHSPYLAIFRIVHDVQLFSILQCWSVFICHKSYFPLRKQKPFISSFKTHFSFSLRLCRFLNCTAIWRAPSMYGGRRETLPFIPPTIHYNLCFDCQRKYIRFQLNFNCNKTYPNPYGGERT